MSGRHPSSKHWVHTSLPAENNKSFHCAYGSLLIFFFFCNMQTATGLRLKIPRVLHFQVLMWHEIAKERLFFSAFPLDRGLGIARSSPKTHREAGGIRHQVAAPSWALYMSCLAGFWGFPASISLLFLSPSEEAEVGTLS